MFKNYLTTTFRSLWKNKTFTFINITGLAVGTLCCLYILLYVKEQFSYDKHHRDLENIYRITTTIQNTDGSVSALATAGPPVAPAMKNDFPEIAQYTRAVTTYVGGATHHVLQYNERSFYEQDALFVDSTFFDVFTYHFIYGNPAKALTAPYSIVLLKPTAEKLFGKENPVGKLIKIDNSFGNHDFTVTGVVDESLGRSHIHANMFITMNSGGIGEYVLNNNQWAGNNFAAAYVKLSPKASATTLEKKLPAFLQKYGEEQLKNAGMKKQLHLQPVADIHTTPGYKVELTKTVNPTFLYTLLLIAALVQIIACINFMNLSTARASKRAKEVGVRKVIGAARKDLVKQFLGESFLLALISVLVALPLLLLVLPYLNQVAQATIQVSFLKDYRIWLILFGLVFITGLLAGSYPSFYLSAFRAVKVIKGNFTSHISAAGIRRSLVVFQFVLSVALITGIIIINRQLNYIKNKDLGFEKDQQLILTFHTDEAKSKIQPLVNDLRQLPEIKAVSRSSHYPTQLLYDIHFYPEGKTMEDGENVQFISTDEHFIKATGITLVSGRNFRANDSGRVIINETLAREMGMAPATAPGKKLYAKDSYTDNNSVFSVEIAGVIKDINFSSLHETVKPFLLWYDADRDKTIIVNTSSKDYTTLLSVINKVWRKNLPAIPFDYSFLDEEVQQQYETEITLSRIINSFTLVAILISCLGLFGLAAFNAEQRTKEIGIRKVLGASISGIVQLLSKDFLKLVLIAIVVATPIVWWAMNKWLQAFAYRVEISWWMFAAAGAVAMLIALATVSFQAIRAAIVNPVKSLRTE